MKSKHGKLPLLVLSILFFTFMLSIVSVKADERVPPFINTLADGSTISRISVEQTTLWAYFISKENNAKWTILIAPKENIESAKKLYLSKSMEPSVQPLELESPIGDDAIGWKSKDGGTIIFRRGTIVGIISGALEWQILLNKSEELDKLFRTTPTEDLFRQIQQQ